MSGMHLRPSVVIAADPELRKGEAKVLQCGLGADAPRGRRGLVSARSGESCREAARGLPASVPVLVGCDIPDVSPLNLVAALRKDCADRPVYLVAELLSGSLASNADAAGATGILSPTDVARMLDGWLSDRGWAEPESVARVRGEFFGGAAVVDDAGESAAGHPAGSAPVAAGKEADGSRGVGILVVSGSGGVGKSTLCVLLAALARSHGFSAGIVDLDAQFGDLAFLCENDAGFHMVRLARPGGQGGQLESIAPLIGESPAEAVPLVFFDGGPEYAEAATPLLIEALRAMVGRYQVVVANSGANWDDLHAEAMDVCDIVMLVMDQRPSSVRRCIEARDLCLRMGIPSSKLAFVLNRCSHKGQVTSYDCALSLGVDRVFEVADGGGEVDEVLSFGVPGRLLDAGNPAVGSADEMLRQILGMLGLKVEGPGGQRARTWKGIARTRKGRRGRDVSVG